VENREYKAQRSILADVDAGKITKEELFARAEELMRERLPKPAAAHKPAPPAVAKPAPATGAVPAAAGAKPASPAAGDVVSAGV
jgi:hypothetical protein